MKYYEYHIEYKTINGWEGDRISGNCRKRNDEKWLRYLKRPETRMTLYIKDEDKELADIIILKIL